MRQTRLDETRHEANPTGAASEQLRLARRYDARHTVGQQRRRPEYGRRAGRLCYATRHCDRLNLFPLRRRQPIELT